MTLCWGEVRTTLKRSVHAPPARGDRNARVTSVDVPACDRGRVLGDGSAADGAKAVPKADNDASPRSHDEVVNGSVHRRVEVERGEIEVRVRRSASTVR